MSQIDATNAAAAVRAVADARGVSEDELWQAVADAMHAAYLKMPDSARDVDVLIDVDTFAVRVVSYDQGSAGVDVTPDGFGRVAAAAFKNAVAAKVGDVVRRQALERFRGRELSLVHGTVRHVTDRRAVVEVEGVDAVLPRGEMLPGDRLHRGDAVAALLVELRPTGDDALLLSRTHNQFVPALFAAHVPEVRDGRVVLDAVVRDPGRRAKVAVRVGRDVRDAVAAVVGSGGQKIRAVQRDLGGERIDVVAAHPDLARFVAAALGADESVQLSVLDRSDAGRPVVEVSASDALKAKLVGREGVNVRLAQKLTGCRIVFSGDTDGSGRDLTANSTDLSAG